MQRSFLSPSGCSYHLNMGTQALYTFCFCDFSSRLRSHLNPFCWLCGPKFSNRVWRDSQDVSDSMRSSHLLSILGAVGVFISALWDDMRVM